MIKFLPLAMLLLSNLALAQETSPILQDLKNHRRQTERAMMNRVGLHGRIMSVKKTDVTDRVRLVSIYYHSLQKVSILFLDDQAAIYRDAKMDLFNTSLDEIIWEYDIIETNDSIYNKLNLYWSMKYKWRLTLRNWIDDKAIHENGQGTTIGAGCNFSSSPSPSYLELIETVKSEDLDKLKNWCFSIYPHRRILGIIGLTYLDHEYFVQSNRSAITDIRGRAEFCSGCTRWESLSVNEFMESSWLPSLTGSLTHNLKSDDSFKRRSKKKRYQ